MITIIRYTNTHDIVITIAAEQARTRKLANGRTERLVFGRWHTRFGGWTSRPEWHLMSVR